MKDKDEFFDNVELVTEKDIEKAKKKRKKKKSIDMSPMKKGSSYEKVINNEDIDKEEILEEEVEVEPQQEEYLVEYDIVEEKKEENKIKPIYIGFTPRLIVNIILVPILSVLSIIFLYKSFAVDDLVNIRYVEQGIIEDTKDNDNIKLDLAYQFKVNKESSFIFNHKVLADLYIVNKEDKENVYFKESYSLIDNEEKQIKNSKKYTTREEVEINIKDYEEIVNKYTSSYDIETFSYLEVYLLVDYKSLSTNSYYLSDEVKNSIIIPINEENPVLEKNVVDREQRVNIKPTVHLESPGYLGLGILAAIGAILTLTESIILIYSTLDQKSIYDKKIEQILKKNKKRIVETTKTPKQKGKKVIPVNNIKDLIVISKKIKKPVNYCIINEHNKSQFYIENNNELYLYIIKAVDLEKKD